MRRSGSIICAALWLTAWALADVLHRPHAHPPRVVCEFDVCTLSDAEPPAPDDGSHDAERCDLCRFALTPALPGAPSLSAAAPRDLCPAPVSRPPLHPDRPIVRLLPPSCGPPASA